MRSNGKAVNSNLNKNEYVTPTIKGGQILIGGYSEIGKMVVVNIRFKATSTNQLIYLPKPTIDYVGVRINCIEDKTRDTNNALNKQYGILDIYPTVANNTYEVNFVYLKQ